MLCALPQVACGCAPVNGLSSPGGQAPCAPQAVLSPHAQLRRRFRGEPLTGGCRACHAADAHPRGAVGGADGLHPLLHRRGAVQASSRAAHQQAVRGEHVDTHEGGHGGQLQVGVLQACRPAGPQRRAAQEGVRVLERRHGVRGAQCLPGGRRPARRQLLAGCVVLQALLLLLPGPALLAARLHGLRAGQGHVWLRVHGHVRHGQLRGRWLAAGVLHGLTPQLLALCAARCGQRDVSLPGGSACTWGCLPLTSAGG